MTSSLGRNSQDGGIIMLRNLGIATSVSIIIGYGLIGLGMPTDPVLGTCAIVWLLVFGVCLYLS